MIAVGTLFLFGTALVSGSVIRDSYKYPPAITTGHYGLPIQVSNNGAYISVLYHKCEHGDQIISAPPPLPEFATLTPIIVEEPKEPIIIPEAPQLGPFVIPEFPVGEENAISYVPETPTPAVYEEPIYANIPEVPTLPPFTLPELPVGISESEPSLVLAPYPATSFELAHDDQNCGHILPSAPEWPAVPSEIETPEFPFVIPEAPKLGPFILPEFPVRFEVPESLVLAPYPAATNLPEIQTLIDIEAPKAPVVMSEAPILKQVIPETAPVIFEEPIAPVLIPEAPELGPLVFPKFPIRIEVPEAPVRISEKETCKHSEINEISAPVIIYEEPKVPTIIPEAPELGPLVLPEFPIRGNVPEAHIVISEKETPTPVIIEAPEAPIIIPEPPVLGPFTLPEFPIRIEVPEAPVLITEKEACKHSDVIEIPEPAPVIIDEPEEPKVPIIIPEAPELGPLVWPEFPVRVEIPAPVPIIPNAPELPAFEAIETHDIPYTNEIPASAPVVIPEAPVLPPLVLPEFPTNVITEVIPEGPEQAEPCVHNFVLPTLIDDNKYLQVIPAAPELAPLIPYFPTIEANYIPGPPAITYALPQ